MPVSLHLPYAVCYPLTRLARRLSRRRDDDLSFDQAAYFDHQYRSTAVMRERFMGGVSLAGKVVLDVGSGLGGRAAYWLEQGAEHVYCIDVNRQELREGAALTAARHPASAPRIEFRHPDEMPTAAVGDVAILFDVFEHLVDPAAVLRQCHGWLRPGGQLWIGSIGWYHYLASHCAFHIPIPWSQVLFSERAIIRTIRTVVRRPDYVPNAWERLEGIERWDQVATLKDRPGEPLNMLSLRSVQAILKASPFELTRFTAYGFGGQSHPAARALAWLAKVPVARELFHSYYTAVLTKPRNGS